MGIERIWYERVRLVFGVNDKSESLEIPIKAGLDHNIVLQQYFQTNDVYGIEVVIRYRVVEKSGRQE